jgi:hypothetical protein
MGYFGFRAAPMGPVPAGVVEATFFHFHPDRVRRAIPEAWSRARPEVMVEVRSTAAAVTLRRLMSHDEAERIAAQSLGLLHSAIDAAPASGRPLFAANRDTPKPSDPVAALWHATTTLREHRGDGHLAILTSAGLDGCESLALFSACKGIDKELFFKLRGWSPEDWGAAVDRLKSQGLLGPLGAPTVKGHNAHVDIERRTDELAAEPYARLADDQVTELLAVLSDAQRRIVAGGEIFFPNPIGLPAPAY